MADELKIDSGALIFATLADVYLSSGMIDEAISILKDGLVRNPGYTLAKIILGRAYYMKDDIKEAVKILEEVYTEAPDSENTNLYLGHCYKKLGENEKALKFYEATIKINPENSEAKKELELLKSEKVEEKVAPEEEPKPEAVEVAVPAEEEVIKEEKPQEVEAAVPTEEEVIEEKPQEVEAAVPTAKEVIEEKPQEEVKPEIEEKVEENVEKEKPPEETKPAVVEEKVEPQPAPAVEVTKEEPLPEIGLEEAEKKETPLQALEAPMQRLLKIKSVKGAFICSRDGLLIQSYYDRPDIEELCALIASVISDADESFKFLQKDSLERGIIEKADETICVVTAGESLLTVITEPEAKPGLVFIYARKIIEEIKEILG